jgi:hypothetical protein
MNFSRSKKDKTADKRAALEDKKTAEVDPSATNSTDSVENLFLYEFLIDLSFIRFLI